MAALIPKTASLGEVIAAVFDEAALLSTDSGEVALLATRAVRHILRRGRPRRTQDVVAGARPARSRRSSRNHRRQASF